MAGDDHAGCIDEDRIVPTELPDAGCDLIDLRVGVGARVAEEDRQRGDVHALDAVALGDHGNLVGWKPGSGNLSGNLRGGNWNPEPGFPAQGSTLIHRGSE